MRVVIPTSIPFALVSFAYRSLRLSFSFVGVLSPVISLLPLSGDQQAALCVASVVRILENHKTIAAAGGANLRIALLARLVAQVAWALSICQIHVCEVIVVFITYELSAARFMPNLVG